MYHVFLRMDHRNHWIHMGHIIVYIALDFFHRNPRQRQTNEKGDTFVYCLLSNHDFIYLLYFCAFDHGATSLTKTNQRTHDK